MAMTQQQYIARKGVRCPFCGNEDIAATTASTYFAVSGRIPGDYEDTTLTFSLPEKATREDAVQAFEAMVYKSRGRSREDVIEQYGEPLYIGEVLQSATPINKV